ncbi:MAG TPA: transposase [Nakamurella sp.]|nr:transposase [Nakamurella sp.]
MTGGSPQEPGEWFSAPEQVNHRRYEALRAFHVEGLTHAQAAARFGYTRWAMVNLVREHRAGRLDLFAPTRKPGPPPGSAPAKDRARGRVIALRRQGLSTYEISTQLAVEHTPLNRTSVAEILTEEGFGRLLRHPEPAASINPATPGRDTGLPRTAKLDFTSWPARVETGKAGLLLLVPDLIALDLPALVRAAGYTGTRVVPALSWLLSLLALKLTRTRGVSHVDDLLLSDPAAGLFAGLGILPKKSALTDYSYRTSHTHQRAFLAALDAKMIAAGLATRADAIFDLDFHAVMHWGHDPVLEKHYVPTRSQRARSVLTFFAQDSGTHNLLYANAEVSKATQAREVIAFCDHWKAVSGADPHMLIMDQKVTTQPVLAELDERGIKFLTLRMRSPTLVTQINALTPGDFNTLTLNRPGRHNRPRVHQSRARLTGYPNTVRQLIVTGLGREAPTVIITNNEDLTAKALIEHYARRMTIEQRLAEIIGAFHADALSSTVNLNVDLDITLCVLSQALLAALRARLPGYTAVTPDVLQRRFLETPGTITTTADTTTVRLDRRAYAPVLRTADLPNDTIVPWWGNRTLRYEIS